MLSNFRQLSDRLLLLAAAIALTAGLAGAFVGLATSSFWLDELWTVWTIGDVAGDGIAVVLQRALTDAHPPLYYLSLNGWAAVFGRSETALRGFSAALSVAAVIVFGIGTRGYYSLPARMVAMVVAVSSGFWFEQSQNARSYGLGMLVGSILLTLGVRLCTRDRAGAPVKATFFALLTTSLFGAFVHSYLVLIGAAVFLALVPFCQRLRMPLIMVAVLLPIIAFAYVRMVITPNSVWNMGTSWIKNDLGWFIFQSKKSVLYSIGGYSRNINILLLFSIVAAVIHSPVIWLRATAKAANPLFFTLLVPAIVYAAGIASSLVLAPNFTDRNMLLVSPFIWATIAFGYDVGVAKLDRLRPVANLVLAVMLLLTTAQLPDRFQPHTTPYRASAAWIAGQPGCAHAKIMVLYGSREEMKPGESDRQALHAYGYYLTAHHLYPAFITDLLDGRIKPTPTCPVVAWAAHYLRGDGVEKVRAKLQSSLGYPVAIKPFPVADDIGDWRTVYVFVAQEQHE